jgi:DNA-directed RNA polymerase subunit RPC12/RpoP
MENVSYYDQDCPTCGRALRIRKTYLGRRVQCRHCNAEFEACEPGSAEYPPSDSGIALLQRADELIAAADRHSPPLGGSGVLM